MKELIFFSAAAPGLELDFAVATPSEAVAVTISVVPVAVSVAVSAVVVPQLVFVMGMRSAVVSDVVDGETNSVISCNVIS